MIFYENVGSPAHAAEVIERVKDITAEPIIIDDRALRLTASIGAASCPEDGDALEPLMRAADVAMYSDKQR